MVFYSALKVDTLLENVLGEKVKADTDCGQC